MCENGYLKLIDFGVACLLEEGQLGKTLCGTPEYMAPEMIKQNRSYEKSVDWWAFGVLIYEMLAGVSPFFDQNKQTLWWNIENEPVKWTENTQHASEEFKDLVTSLLRKNPSERLGYDMGIFEILGHAWFPQGAELKQI